MWKFALAAVIGCWSFCAGCGGEAVLRKSLSRTSGVVRLPAGVIEMQTELVIPDGAHDLEIRGASSGTVLRASDNFRGRALLVVRSASNISFRNFTIDGNRGALRRPAELPPSNVPFWKFSLRNGILAEGVRGLNISGLEFRNVAGFPVLVANAREVLVEGVHVEDCGSDNAKGRNNASGGILIEEGTSAFQVLRCRLKKVLGNGIWTHSLYTSPRNSGGLIANNRLELIGRDAIQIGHATKVRVENNTGARIGYPMETVDAEGGGIPVAIDTAGNVDRSVYARNQFEEVDGKCIDLDGFHDGEVSENSCVNLGRAEDYPYGHFGIVFNNSNPDMRSENVLVRGNEIDGAKLGGIFLIGGGHRIVDNRLLHLNKAHCNEGGAKLGCNYYPKEPDLLRAGIYLGRGADRPDASRNNLVAGNEISGYGMQRHCIAAAPGVSLSANRIRDNHCSGESGER